MGETEKDWSYELVTPAGTFNNANDHSGDGKATMTWTAGEIADKYGANCSETYQGEYVDKRRNGHGKYVYLNGDVYTGTWQEGNKFKYGELVYKTSGGDPEDESAGPPRGGKYAGNYGDESAGEHFGSNDNVRNGEGTFQYANGDHYSGGWVKGKKQGTGTYFFKSDRTRLVGQWKDGKILSGKWIFPNGTYYIGKFENGKPSGVGNWVFKNGAQLNGFYTQKPKEGQEETPEEEADKPVAVDVAWTSSTIVAVAG